MGCVSCQKVSNLSDKAGVESCTVTSFNDSVRIYPGSAKIENNSVIIPLDYGRKFFPLTVSVDFKFSSTTVGTLPIDKDHSIDFNDITFKDVYDQPTFYLISESGIPHLWSIQFKDKQNAEIEQFSLKNTLPPGYIQNIIIEKNNIHIILGKSVKTWPFVITPEIQKTTTATYKGTDYQEGQDLEFNTFDDVKNITLVADNGDERVWNIYLESSTPQLKNSNFDLWINTDLIDGEQNKKINIDPVPGKGLGWSTANNTYVRGSVPVERNGGFAAQMTTSVQYLGFIGLGNLLAAGTVYTGSFHLNLQLDQPRQMTFFSIPFTARPNAVEVDAQYIAGKLMQRSVKEGSSYVLKDIPDGKDKGHIWVKLLNWQGQGELAYHGEEVLLSGLSVVGEGEHIFYGTANEAEWQSVRVDINYKDLVKEATHIAIVMTSSKDGDSFLGAVGSTLRVDNLSLIYE